MEFNLLVITKRINKFMKKNKNVICYAATLYSLLLYLINCNDEEIDETFYVLDPTFPKGYEKRLSYCYRVPDLRIRHTIDIWKDWLIYRILFFLNIPRVNNQTFFFIQDHKYAAKILVRDHYYTLIEDSAGVCSRYFNGASGKSMINVREKYNYRILRFLYGPLWGYHFGCSSQCQSLLFTQEDTHPFLNDKKRIILPKIDNSLWMSFSDYKRKRILEIYDLSEKDLATISSKRYLLLTDPVWPDDAPYEEHDRVFHEVISKYPSDDLIIKTHPRDINYPYEKEFPGVSVFRKAIPMEIFKLVGTQFSTIITLFSTAVTQFENVNIDWFGTEISPYCFKNYGHIEPPVKVNKINI